MIPAEEFFASAARDAEEEADDGDMLQEVDLAEHELKKAKPYNQRQPIRGFVNDFLKDSFVVDVLKEGVVESGKVMKSVSKIVIKGIAAGVSMGIILVIGGAIVWQVVAVPAYCNGPLPAIANWLPVSNYWGWNENGICRDYFNTASSSRGVADDFSWEGQAQAGAESAKLRAVVQNLPPDVRNGNIPGFCKIDNDGQKIWCDSRLCEYEKLRGC